MNAIRLRQPNDRRPFPFIIRGIARGVWIMREPVVLITGVPVGIGRAAAVGVAKERASLVVCRRFDVARHD